ncbi:DUF6318 family protein [Micrococcaceae bacterium Sec5.7]
MTSRTFTSSRLRTPAVAVLAAAVLALTACNGGGNPGGGGSTSASPSVSATPSATPTPTPTAVYKPADAKGKAQNVPVPVLPAAAKAKTKAGLEAFAKYWYTLMNYAYESGDLKQVDDVTGSNCASCKRVRPTIEAWNSGGQWIVGGRLAIVSADSKFTADADGNYQAIIQYHRQAISYHRADGGIEQSSPKTSLQADILIAKYADGMWSASNVDRIGG